MGRTDAWIASQLEVELKDLREFKQSLSDGPEQEEAPAIDESTVLDATGSPIVDREALRATEVALAQVSDALIHALAEKPELLHTLHWRKFEELVAELLLREGFDVTLTSGSHDRGVDIYAVRHEAFGHSLYLVECKRHSPNRPVGPGMVRHLYGAVERERATQGLLATTSTFTSGAIAEQRDVEFRLSLHDFSAIRDWLRRIRKDADSSGITRPVGP
jgi:restriction endonuclease Mrr